MKNVFAFSLSLAALSLVACQAPASNQAELDAMQEDIKELQIAVFGDPLATCEEANILDGISAYASTLEGLPGADLDPAEWHKVNGERDGVFTTPSGLQYSIVQKGNDAAPSPVGGQMIKVNYHGIFPNGDTFDSAYDRGQPAEFPANRVIQGWVEGLGDMKPCEARTLYIPGDLAYGEKGRGEIPPNATLLFHVQLLGIDQK